MKIFTLLTQLLKNFTGLTSRNLAFKSSTRNAQRVTRIIQRSTNNVQRVTPYRQGSTHNAQRVTPDTAVHTGEPISQMNESVEHPMVPTNDSKDFFEYKILPVKNTEVPTSNKIHSVEYKILPVQKKITSVQNIKPVFMQNFFAIVKKIFSLSDHPKTLLENLNDGYHPGCCYGTAGTENNSRTNEHHDVASSAASFAFIPLPLTPTAMNHPEQKSVKKTITGRSGIFGIMMLMSSLFISLTVCGQAASATWNFVSDGSATVSGNVTATAVTSTGFFGTSFSNGFQMTGTTNATTWAADGTTTTTNATFTGINTTTRNIQFTISPKNCNNLNITSMSVPVTLGGGQTGTMYAAVAYSTNGFSTFTFLPATTNNQGTNVPQSGTTITLSATGLNVSVVNGNTLSLRIILWRKNAATVTGTTVTIGTVVINGTTTSTAPAAPVVTTPVTYCQSGTAIALTATGSNLLWYTVSTGGTGNIAAPIPSTASAGTTPYYVSQTISGCESSRANISVIIDPSLNPTTTVNGSTNITCNGASDGTITIAVTGGTPDYYFSVDNGNTYTPGTHSTPYTYPGLNANTPYTIRVKDTNGCQSQTF
jgi:hypothetical protein